MLKSCPSCSYIGNDGEHVCPFCKADLCAGLPRLTDSLTEDARALRSLGGTRRSMYTHGSHTRVSGLFACYRTNEELTPTIADWPLAHGWNADQRM